MDPKQSFLQKIGGFVNKTIHGNVVNYKRPKQSTPSFDPKRFAEAIAYNETRGVQGDPYRFSRYSGNPKQGDALGTYQVTEGELKTYGSRYLGQPMSSQQFLASSTAQDTYVKSKGQYYADMGYQPADIADIHRAGYTKSYPAGSGQYQNPGYVESFKNIYNATSSPAGR